jgi:thiamine kinase-like enzyme
MRRALKLLDPTIVRVPRVHRYFEQTYTYEEWESQNGLVWPARTSINGYLIIEYVHGSPIAEEDCVSAANEIARILEYFSSICHDIPGPLAGGISRGLFWEDDYPRLGSKENLESWMNRRLETENLEISLKETRLIFSHLDLWPRNILRMPNGSLCLLDWASAGFYPAAFEVAMLRSMPSHDKIDWKFKEALLIRLSHLQSYEEAQVTYAIRAWGNGQRFH